MGFPGGSDSKVSDRSAGDPSFLGWEDPLEKEMVRKIPWRRKWQPTPVLLPRKFHGLRSLVGYSPWGHKESDRTERLHFHFHINIFGSNETSWGQLITKWLMQLLPFANGTCIFQ